MFGDIPSRRFAVLGLSALAVVMVIYHYPFEQIMTIATIITGALAADKIISAKNGKSTSENEDSVDKVIT